MAGNCGGEF